MESIIAFCDGERYEWDNPFAIDVLGADGETPVRGGVMDLIEGEGMLVEFRSSKMPQRLTKFSEAGRFLVMHRKLPVDLAHNRCFPLIRLSETDPLVWCPDKFVPDVKVKCQS